MADEEPEGRKGPWWNTASSSCRASAKDRGFPKAIVVTWCFKALRCCWWNEFSSGFVMEKIQAEEMIPASGRTLWIKAGDIQNLT